MPGVHRGGRGGEWVSCTRENFYETSTGTAPYDSGTNTGACVRRQGRSKGNDGNEVEAPRLPLSREAAVRDADVCEEEGQGAARA